MSNSDINLGNIIILDAAGVGNAGELQSDIKTDDIEIGFRGGVFDFDGKLDTKGFAVYCSGDWTNTGTFVNGSGTVIFNGDAAQTIISGGQDFYNVTLDNNSIELTMTAGNPLTIDGALVISASKMPTITIYGNNLTVNGTTNGSVGATSESLTIVGGLGDVTFNGAIGATKALSGLTITGKEITLGNIGGASGGVTGDIDIIASSKLTFSGTVYNANAQSYEVYGPGDNIIVNSGSTTTFTSSNDDIIFEALTASLKLTNNTDLIVNSGGGTIAIMRINGTAGEHEAVTLNAGAGSVLLNGGIGNNGTDDIHSVSLSAGTEIFLAGNIYTANVVGNSVLLDGPVYISVGIVISTDNALNDGDITLTSNLYSAAMGNSITLTAGSADVSIAGTIGPASDKLISSATITGTNIDIANIGGAGYAGMTGTAAFTALGDLNLNGTTYNANEQNYSGAAINVGNVATVFKSSADSISFNGPVNLAGNANINTNDGVVTGAAIDFTSTINGGWQLTLDSGTSGDITISDNIGAITPLAVFTVSGGDTISLEDVTTVNDIVLQNTGTTTLNGDIRSNNTGHITVTGPVTLADNISVITNGLNPAADNITFISTINGNNSLTINSGIADISIADDIGTVTPLNTIICTGNTISIYNVATAGAQTYNGATTLNGGLNSTVAGKITINGNVTLGNIATVNLDTKGAAGDDIIINGTIDDDVLNTTNILVHPGAFGNVEFNGDIGSITGVNSLTIGDVDYSDGGSTVLNDVTAAVGININTTGLITLKGSLISNGNATGIIYLAGNVTLSAPNITIQADSNGIGFRQAIDGACNLTISAPDTHDITITGKIGSATPLNDLTVSADTITFSDTAQINGNLIVNTGLLNTADDITVNGGSATGSGTITMFGGTFILDGTGNFGGGNDWSFNNLTFGNGAGATATTTTGAGNITVDGLLTIESNQTLDAGAPVWILTAAGTPFVIKAGGVFTPGISTVAYAGAAATDVTSTTYHNLWVGQAGTIFTAAGDINVNNNFEVASGDFDCTNRTLTIGGDFTANAVGAQFNPGTGEVIFNDNSKVSHIHGTTFDDLTCTTAGKTLEFDGGATETVNGILTLGNAAGNVTIQGAGGAQWTLNLVSGDFSNVSFVAVRDSINAYGVATNTWANPANSVNLGNTVRWFGSNPVDPPVEPPIVDPIPNPIITLVTFDDADYEEGKKKRKYPKGRYKTAVIVYEGVVVVTPYDETGEHPERAARLTSGQSATQIGEIK